MIGTFFSRLHARTVRIAYKVFYFLDPNFLSLVRTVHVGARQPSSLAGVYESTYVSFPFSFPTFATYGTKLQTLYNEQQLSQNPSTTN
jgi:hypothetical protein